MGSKTLARQVFSYMRAKGLITRTAVHEPNIKGLSSKKILDIAKELAHMTEIPKGNPPGMELGHSASVSLAGGRGECDEINCRLRRLHGLGQFAAFYSDRVYMRNPFSDYVHRTTYGLEDELKRDFFEDVRVAIYLKPLLQQGLVRFVSETGQLCPKCLAGAMGLGADGGSKFRRVCNKLGRDLFANTKYELVKRDRFYLVGISGPELYYEHCSPHCLYRKLPEAVSSRPRIVHKLKKRGRIQLSRTLSYELNLHKDLAREVVHNVAYHLLVNKYLGTSFLTDKQLHLAFLRHFSKDNSMEERNAIAQKYLTTMVPFLDDVPICDLLTLRRREEESFIQFRVRLTSAIEEFRSEGTAFTSKSARAIYQDILAPQLARLDKRVGKAKRDLISSAARSVVGMAGAISFGLFTGLIGTEVAAIAKAVGVVSFGSDVIKKVLALGDAKKKIEEDDLYFLWQVRRTARRI